MAQTSQRSQNTSLIGAIPPGRHPHNQMPPHPPLRCCESTRRSASIYKERGAFRGARLIVVDVRPESSSDQIRL